ncbi:MAG: HypC/HybG/HupF family hydrogenase formation chaperone [Thermodesulfobacteriota bacterium]
MCLAIPARVVEICDLSALVDVQGARRQANLMLLPEPVAVGEFVLVHAGFAIQKLDRQEGEETLRLFHEVMGRMQEGEI